MQMEIAAVMDSDSAAQHGVQFRDATGDEVTVEAAEAIIVERDIRLVEMTGARYHFAQISTAASLDIIASAKQRGLPVTCGVSAHHLALNELDVGSYYTFRKVKPPLRSEADRAAMVEGVASGLIDIIVSSHDPQGADTKRQPFAAAAFGAVGLETLLPAALARSGSRSWSAPKNASHAIHPRGRPEIPDVPEIEVPSPAISSGPTTNTTTSADSDDGR